MSPSPKSLDTSRSVTFLWKVLFWLNVVFLAIALLCAFLFKASWGLEMLLWFLTCEVLLLVVIFLPVFLFQLSWRRQRPRVAVQSSLDAFVDAITHLAP